MIVNIGLMIGLYIITRMISFGTRKGDREESKGVKVFVVITIVVTILLIIDLLVRGTSSLPSGL